MLLFTIQTFILASLLALVTASQPSDRLRDNATAAQFHLPLLFPRGAAHLLEARQTTSCDLGEVTCYDSCLPSGWTCCSALGGCGPDYYCDTGGCCENGQICDGYSGECQKGTTRCGADCLVDGTTCTVDDDEPVPGGTDDSSGSGGGSGGSGSCASGQTSCGTGCMPIGSVCCEGSSEYCLAGDYCVPNGCCPLGEVCSGGGGVVTIDGTSTDTDTAVFGQSSQAQSDTTLAPTQVTAAETQPADVTSVRTSVAAGGGGSTTTPRTTGTVTPSSIGSGQDSSAVQLSLKAGCAALGLAVLIALAL